MKNKEYVKIKFDGYNYIDSKDFIVVLNSLEALYSTGSKKPKIEIKNISSGSILIDFNVEVINTLFDSNNIEAMKSFISQFSIEVILLFLAVNTQNLLGIPSAILSDKIVNRNKFSYEETMALMQYCNENPVNGVSNNIKTVKALKGLAKNVIERNADLTVTNGTTDTVMSVDTAHLISNLSTESNIDEQEYEELVVFMNLKTIALMGNEKWTVYDVSNARKAIKLSINEELFNLVDSKQITFQKGDVINAVVRIFEKSNNTKTYQMIRYIGKVNH